MKRFLLFLVLLLVVVTRASADTAADTAAFAAKVDLTPLRTIAVMDQQTVKTLDSFSRQVLERITGRSTFNGQDPVFTLLDIIYHPDAYQSANLIKIKSLPLRTEFRRLSSIPSDEQERIVKTGMVSMQLLDQPEVREMFSNVQAADVRKAEACQQVLGAYQQIHDLCFSIVQLNDLFLPAQVVPPAVGTKDTTWHRVIEIVWNDPIITARARANHGEIPAPLPGYTAEQVQPVLKAAAALHEAWHDRDADAVNIASKDLSKGLSQVNLAVYPSQLLRNVEVVYNRLAKMTLPGAAFYFFALVCFLMSTSSGLSSLRLWGLRLLVLGYLIHTTGIGVRWWLEGSIPIKNEFESVMFSAWFGVTVGLLLELRFGRSFFGAGAGFVGFLSLVALFTVPYVLHITIGENVGQVNGVLMSYWLYIHVTMVTASYAMIGMSFLLSCWWLIKYCIDYGTISRLSSRATEGSGHGFDPVFPAGSAVSLSMTGTLARMLFIPVGVAEPVKTVRIAADSALDASSANFLATLDACNLVVLQLAFWTLGIGIVLGAIWADQSWGRFWAWDPKETFALVTWIAYLIIVHVRVATQDKAWWTAVLSIIGFFLMLFNWIGVNYFLPGLHSYAG
jgi:cytochrome c-type biogenesis protein CcsB